MKKKNLQKATDEATSDLRRLGRRLETVRLVQNSS
jgi:hypothetical protein